MHVWNDGGLQLQGPTHSAQLVLDGVAYITDAMASVGSQPTKLVKSWVTDKIRPAYWRPDSEIIVSVLCGKFVWKWIVVFIEIFLCRPKKTALQRMHQQLRALGSEEASLSQLWGRVLQPLLQA